MSCRWTIARTNMLVNYCCQSAACCIRPPALPSSPRTLLALPQVELVAGPTTTLPPDSRPISQFTNLDTRGSQSHPRPLC